MKPSIESAASGALMALDVAKQAGKSASDFLADSRATNYVDFNRSTRVRFPVCIDSALEHEPETNEILRAVHKSYVSEYLRALQLLTDLTGFEVINRLEKLNPDARWLGGDLDLIVSGESAPPLKGGVNDPRFDLSDFLHATSPIASTEGTPVTPQDVRDERKRRNLKTQQGKVNDGPKKMDFAIGSEVDVVFKQNGADIPIKISIALQMFQEESAAIVSAMHIAGGRNTFANRFHRYRAKEISADEMFLMTDILKAYRDIYISSSGNNFLKEITRRRMNVQTRRVVADTVAQLSACIVLHKDTAEQIERVSRLRFDKRRDRESIMDIMSCMMIVVVDTDSEKLEMYHTGINKGSTIYFHGLRQFNDDKQVSISDLLSKTNTAVGNKGSIF